MASSGNSRPMMTTYGGVDEAFFLIHAATGEILDCNDAATRLLGLVSAAPIGAAWNRAIRWDADSESILEHALQAGRRLVLPPLILQRPNAPEIAVGGLLCPCEQDHRGAIFRLLLWPLLHQDQLSIPDPLPESDTLAIVGLDQLRFDAQWGAPETARLMADVRDSLLEIVRSGDTVGSPSATAILVILRDVDIEGARDICRAVLSHLRRLHTRPDSSAAGARICVGLANRRPGASALATLLDANNALLQAQQTGTAEPIRAASEDDRKRIAGAITHYGGVFSEPFAVPVTKPGASRDERVGSKFVSQERVDLSRLRRPCLQRKQTV